MHPEVRLPVPIGPAAPGLELTGVAQRRPRGPWTAIPRASSQLLSIRAYVAGVTVLAAGAAPAAAHIPNQRRL